MCDIKLILSEIDKKIASLESKKKIPIRKSQTSRAECSAAIQYVGAVGFGRVKTKVDEEALHDPRESPILIDDEIQQDPPTLPEVVEETIQEVPQALLETSIKIEEEIFQEQPGSIEVEVPKKSSSLIEDEAEEVPRDPTESTPTLKGHEVETENIETPQKISPELEKTESIGERVRSRRAKQKPKRKPRLKPKRIGKPQIFMCDICKKTFTKGYSLSRHMSLHTGERKHACAICDYRFIQRSDLNRHLQSIHVKDPKFKCYFCELKFFTKKSLRSHEILHENALPYECMYPNCGKRYRSNKGCRVHQLREHSGLIYECDFCGKTIQLKDYLKNHMKIHVIGGSKFTPRNKKEFKLHIKTRMDEVEKRFLMGLM